MTDRNFQNFIEELKSRNEIVDVVSAYCQLERKGGSYWACCPLPGHLEKVPSFSVNQAGQFFKCFGCQRGGDVIKFIMEVESLTYMEAVKFLADRVNMDLPETSFKDDARIEENAKTRTARLAILKETAKFYVNNLTAPEAEPYLLYLFDRGFDQKIIRSFGIGCSLDLHSLPKYLNEKGYSYEDMVGAGVVSYNKKTNEYTDFEANRITVPIIDTFSNVLAFGGRVIVKTDFAKYKNTRETNLFIKNRTVFNLNNIKKLKRELGTVPYIILVEGYMDVIALHSYGFKNAVASMGTSLTIEQARLIARYTDTVIVSYDGDSAGQKASFRSFQILKDSGLTVKAIALPDNMDPDEFLKAKSADAYKELLLSAKPYLDYKLWYTAKSYNLNDESAKRRFLEKAISIIAESNMEFEREELLKKLSQISHISYEALKRDLDQFDKKPAYKPVIAQKEAQKEILNDQNATQLAERFILSAILSDKDYAKIEDIYELDFQTPQLDEIASKMIFISDSGDSLNAENLTKALGEDYYDELSRIIGKIEEIYCPDGYDRYYKDCIRWVKRSNLEADLKLLEQTCDKETDTLKQIKIMEQIQKKQKLLYQLKTEDKL